MIGCRPLDEEEVKNLLAALTRGRYATRDQTLVVLGITTGFRISELLSLKIRDLSVGGSLNSHVRIPASRMKGRKRPRSAVLADAARPYLDAWITELNLLGRAGGNSPLFPSRSGSGAISRSQAHRIITDAFDRAGIQGAERELATHCLRKTYASRMWEAHGQNIWRLQNALGHASPASTVAYLSFDDSEQQAAVESAFSNF